MSLLRNIKELNLFSTATVYILLFCLYWLQGIIYEEGSIISRGTLAIILLIGVVYTIKYAFQPKKTPYFRQLLFLLAIFSIYGFILVLENPTIQFMSGNQTSNLYYLKDIWVSLLPIFVFYYFFSKGLLNDLNSVFWSLVFVVLAIIVYLGRGQEQLMTMDMMENATGANNMAYMLLQLFPLIVFIRKNKIIQYALIAIIGFFVIMGFKRGAILIYALCLVYYILRAFRHSSFWSKALIIILSFVVLWLGYGMIGYLLENSSFFQYRLDQITYRDSSGRDDIYSDVLDTYLNAPFVNVILGYGGYGSIRMTGSLAHNDWLEILINQGLIGILIYLIYWITLFKTWFRGRRHSLSLYFMICLIILFVRTFISMSYSDMFFAYDFVFAYILYKLNNTSYAS